MQPLLLPRRRPAPRLRWATSTADRRPSTAARVTDRLPGLVADLAAGEAAHQRVDVAVATSGLFDPGQVRVPDAVLSGRRAGLTTAQVEALVRRGIAMVDSEAVEERARRAVSDRRVGFASPRRGSADRGPRPGAGAALGAGGGG